MGIGNIFKIDDRSSVTIAFEEFPFKMKRAITPPKRV
jgi:hypothetical protein